MSTATLPKSEYLKRYLDAPSTGDKRKVKKKKNTTKKVIGGKSRLQIVDHEVSVSIPSTKKGRMVESEEEEEDDKPTIALVDEIGAEELKLLGKFTTNTFEELVEPSTSTKRKSRRHDSSDDSASPKRRARHDSSDSDISVPRGKNKSKDADDSDLSPERPSGAVDGDSDSDLSPPRATNTGDDEDKRMLPRKTLDGKKAGLQTAKALRKEAEELKRKENKMFKKIGDEVSGKNAETVFRDRASGTKRDLKKEQKLTEEQQKRKQEMEEKYKKWNKGLKQLSDRERQLNEMAAEAEKPVARYRDDEELDAHLKQQMFTDDPMLKYIRSKQHEHTSKTQHVFPKYTGPAAAPNRFAILPGYRWDGVDRSNGFEQKCFSRVNAQTAQDEEFYRWQSGNYE